MDYGALFAQLAEASEAALLRRDQVNAELRRFSALIKPILPMLRGRDRSRAERLLERLEHRPVGLTEAVSLALADGEWRTTRQIRDFLVGIGWFAAYKSNPLVSIQTTLRRLNGTSVETKTVGGVALYRLKPGPSLEQAKARAEHLKQLQDAHESRPAAN